MENLELSQRDTLNFKKPGLFSWGGGIPPPPPVLLHLIVSRSGTDPQLTHFSPSPLPPVKIGEGRKGKMRTRTPDFPFSFLLRGVTAAEETTCCLWDNAFRPKAAAAAAAAAVQWEEGGGGSRHGFWGTAKESTNKYVFFDKIRSEAAIICQIK